jgi:hypothetical protein
LYCFIRENELISLLCGFFSLSPWRIVDDCGGAFSMGAIGGALFHGIKGFRNAPSVRMFLFKILFKLI